MQKLNNEFPVDCPFDDQENLQACFDFRLALTTSWLNRCVENWEYVGDSQWQLKLSLDIDKALVEKTFNEFIGKKFYSSNADSKVINIPIMHVCKSDQFSSFSIKNECDESMRLLLREMGCHVALNQLEGAILTVHGFQADLFHEEKLTPLAERPLLVKFLIQLFREPTPPRREDGSLIRLGDPDVYCAIKANSLLNVDALKMDPEWDKNSISTVRNLFNYYWYHSRVFRYLVTLNSIQWLACVVVDLDHSDFSILKVSYLVTRNFVKEVMRSPYERTRNSGKISFDFNLESMGIGEVTHTMIHAPEGTCFIPSYRKGTVENRIFRLGKKKDLDIRLSDKKNGSEPKFFLVKKLLEKYKNEVEFPSEALAYGVLTPSCVSVKTQMGWARCKQADNDEDQNLNRLYRRIPVFDSHASVYNICLNLAPRLGIKSFGYLAYFGFSFLIMLVFVLNPEIVNLNGQTGMNALTFLLSIAPIVVAILVGSKEETFVNRQIFNIPWLLNLVCTATNVAGLFFLAMKVHNSMPILSCFDFQNISTFLSIVLGIVFLIYCVWFSSYKIKNRWSLKAYSCKVLEIPIYVDGTVKGH